MAWHNMYYKTKCSPLFHKNKQRACRLRDADGKPFAFIRLSFLLPRQGGDRQDGGRQFTFRTSLDSSKYRMPRMVASLEARSVTS